MKTKTNMNTDFSQNEIKNAAKTFYSFLTLGSIGKSIRVEVNSRGKMEINQGFLFFGCGIEGNHTIIEHIVNENSILWKKSEIADYLQQVLWDEEESRR